MNVSFGKLIRALQILKQNLSLTMKDYRVLSYLTSAILVFLTACSDVNQETKEYYTPDFGLKIITRTNILKTTKFRNDLNQNYYMGLQIIEENNNNIYLPYNLKNNIKAEANIHDNELFWNHIQDIFLDENSVNIYGYYPYDPNILFDPLNIPVMISVRNEHTRNYMFGKQSRGHRPINGKNPIALLSMKRALAYINVEVLKDPAIDDAIYLLESIQIGNEPGKSTLSFRGNMNIKTGNIKPLPSSAYATLLKLKSPKLIRKKSSDPNLIYLIPKPEFSDNENVKLYCCINGEYYEYSIHPEYGWEKSHLYTYRFYFDGKKLSLKEHSVSKR